MMGITMGCCSHCFKDTFLTQQIRSLSTLFGSCKYCNANEVALVEPIILRDYFELLLGIYCEDPKGQTLVEWCKSDWELFVDLDNAHCKELLADILDDGEIVRKKYRPVVPEDGNSLERWQRFREELKHQNRFFPKNAPDTNLLEYFLRMHLCADESAIPDILYRARIMDSNLPYPPDEMGKPPKNISTNGRANPAGIPYLYLASDIDTAITEIRPHTSERVCVAEFKVLLKPLVADLRNPRKTISPFSSLSDEESITSLRNEIGFLCQLGEELTRPVLPKAAHLEYLPSQYLCEFIKHLGFGGVMYRSAVGTGTNFAMFDEESLQVGVVETYTIEHVKVEWA